MGHAIHRNGDKYRMWSTIVDRYISDSMTREEMAAWIKEDEMQRLLARIDMETESRLIRADTWGGSGFKRDATRWDTERCDQGRFHHEFDLRPSDGLCKVCGEPRDDHAHEPSCIVEDEPEDDAVDGG